MIFACFFVQIAMADPEWGQVILGFAPTIEIVSNPDMLYLALGIIGATVMPHNLYLHSGIVQTRAYGDSLPEKREALKFATIDSTVALMFALLVNASILILAAATFHRGGHTDGHRPRRGACHAGAAGGLAAGAQALCHCAAVPAASTRRSPPPWPGRSSWRASSTSGCRPGLRRLITRMVAIVPAAGVTLYYGAEGTGTLLILSQVILAFQLPFAIVPLVMFTRDRAKMGALVAPVWLTAGGGHDRGDHHRAQREAVVGHRRRADASALADSGRFPYALAMQDRILIIDFGSQFTQLIARRVREAGVYSEIVPFQLAEKALDWRGPQGHHPVGRPGLRPRGRKPPGPGTRSSPGASRFSASATASRPSAPSWAARSSHPTIANSAAPMSR